MNREELKEYYSNLDYVKLLDKNKSAYKLQGFAPVL